VWSWRIPLLLRSGIGSEELPHQDLHLDVGREVARLDAARVAGRAVPANRLGDVAGELERGTLARSPAGAGALVRASVVDAAGVAVGGGFGYVLHRYTFPCDWVTKGTCSAPASFGAGCPPDKLSRRDRSFLLF